MHLLIIKNGHIIARAESEGAASEFSFMNVEIIPEYPNDGYEYDLDLVDGNPEWVKRPHTPTLQEQIDEIVKRLDETALAWKPGERVFAANDLQNPHYGTADRRFYDGKWYSCRQSHTTQSDWTPNLVPALWEEE